MRRLPAAERSFSPKADAGVGADDVVARAHQLTAVIETGSDGRAPVVKIVAMPPAGPARTPGRVEVVVAISIAAVAAVEAAGHTAPGQNADAGIAAHLVVGGTRQLAAMVALERDGGIGLGRRGVGRSGEGRGCHRGDDQDSHNLSATLFPGMVPA